MTIDFEKDQEQVLDKTTNINKLADKIKELQAQQEQLQIQEDAVKQKKKDRHMFMLCKKLQAQGKAVLNLTLWVQQNMVF